MSRDTSDFSFLPTGDRRLDQILSPKGKGFRYRKDRPISLLITGLPGTGKSTLCCQMACSYVESGAAESVGGAVYFTLDEHEEAVASRISSFGFGTGKRIVTLNDIDDLRAANAETLEELRTKGGVIVKRSYQPLSDLPDLSMRLLKEGRQISQNDLNQIISSDRTARAVEDIVVDSSYVKKLLGWKPILLVLDSINAFFETSSATLPRSAIRFLFDGLRQQTGDHLIFVGELEEGALREHYLADAVIMLRSDNSDGARYLSVTKVRDHDVRPASHKMLIKNDGVRVVPQYIPHFPYDAKLSQAEEKLVFGLPLLDQLLVLPIQSELTASDKEQVTTGLIRGSTTVIAGPPGTRKTFLGMQFLSEGLRKRELSILISFNPQEALPSAFFKGSLTNDVKDLLEVYNFEVPTILEEIEDIILRLALEREPLPKRLVLKDFSAVCRRFGIGMVIPMIERLRYLCSVKGITTIIVLTEPQPERTKEIAGRFGQLCDNIISVAFVGERRHRRETLAICLRKFRSVLLPPRFLTYSLDMNNPESSWIVLDDRFLADIVESETGDFTLGSLRVHYFVGGTENFRRLYEYQQHSLRDHFPGDENECPVLLPFGEVDGKVRTQSALQAMRFHPPFARRHRSEVLVFARPWGDILADRLIPVNNMIDDEERMEIEDFHDETTAALRTSDGSILGLPYYINFSTVAYRNDLLKDVHGLDSVLREKINVDTGEIREPLSWDEVFRAGSFASQEHIRKARSVVPFSYDDYNDDSCATFLFSLICSGEFTIEKDACNMLSRLTANPRQLGRIRDWLNYAYQNTAIPLTLLDKINKNTNGNQEIESVFCWTWYSRVMSLRRKYGDSYISCLPIGDGSEVSWSAGTSVLGGWSLGILDGSLNPERAMAAIRLLRSEEAEREMIRLRACIPSRKRLWTGWFPTNEQEIMRSALDRCSIKGYAGISMSLTEAMKRLLGPLGRSLEDRVTNDGKVVVDSRKRVPLPDVDRIIGTLTEELRSAKL